mgnify:CR=1 FL=1
MVFWSVTSRAIHTAWERGCPFSVMSVALAMQSRGLRASDVAAIAVSVQPGGLEAIIHPMVHEAELRLIAEAEAVDEVDDEDEEEEDGADWEEE